ncbi:MAG: glycosyltransferase [Elusimicrobia bacterium]|nr:glycosyltransferase [Candidatus Obscuribacterium magneticum]
MDSPITGLSVVIPAHNERDGIPSVVNSLTQTLQNIPCPYEIIIVDDGSTDGTAEVIEGRPFVRLIKHDHKMGYGHSLADGINASTHDVIAIMDADGTYPAEYLSDFLSQMESHDMLVGSRKHILPSTLSAKSLARRMLHILGGYLSGHKIIDLNSGFRVFKKELWARYQHFFPVGFSFTTTLTLITHFTGRSLKYIPIDYWPRIGQTKVKYFMDGLRVAKWMLSLTWAFRPTRVWLPFITILAFILRATGTSFGLPGTFNPDEPHHINLAVYFGSGDFNPHVFKYPTLWMYVLSIEYGLLFLLWSGFGLLHQVKDFAHLYIWDPTLFYLTARLTSALLGSLIVIFIYSIGRRLINEEAGIVAALMWAVSPHLVYYAHLAKADMLMLFLLTVGLWYAFKYYQEGGMRTALMSGFFLGLSLSTQYTVAPMLPVLFWAHIVRSVKTREKGARFLVAPEMFCGYGLMMAAFFLGSPFIVTNFQTFLRDIGDLRGYAQGNLTSVGQPLGLGIIRYYAEFLGRPLVGLTVILIGVISLFIWARPTAFLLTGVLVWFGLFWSRQIGNTVVINYTYQVFPVVCLVAGGIWLGLSKIIRYKAINTLIVGLILLTPFIQSIRTTISFLYPDTRETARIWIEEHIPPGSKILLDQIHCEPPLVMSRTQVENLYKRLALEKHPRSYYHKLMLESHPGGGYEITRIQRTPKELLSMPRQTEWAQKGYDLLDVEEGWPALLKARIQYVVLSSFGATPDNSPRLMTFFRDLEKVGVLMKEIFPVKGGSSPVIRIYRIPLPSTR